MQLDVLKAGLMASFPVSQEQISKAREALDVLSALSNVDTQSTTSEAGPSSSIKNENTEGKIVLALNKSIFV